MIIMSLLYDDPLKEHYTHTIIMILNEPTNIQKEWQLFRHGFRKMNEFQNECVLAHFTASHDSFSFTRQTIPFDSLTLWNKLTWIKL